MRSFHNTGGLAVAVFVIGSFQQRVCDILLSWTVAVPQIETAGQDALCCPPVEGDEDEMHTGGVEGPDEVPCDVREENLKHFLHNPFLHYQI